MGLLFWRKKKVVVVEEKPSYFKEALGMVLDQVSSLAIPLLLLSYAAPQKSIDFITDTVTSKFELVQQIDINAIYTAIVDVWVQLVQILISEYEYLYAISLQVPWYLSYVVHFFQLLPMEWLGGLAGVLALIGLCFPWRRLTHWASATLWRTILLFTTAMPLDEGLETLNDKSAGNYHITVMAAAVVASLFLNYALVKGVWWLVVFSVRYVLRSIWRSIFPLKPQPQVVEKVVETVPLVEVKEGDEEEEGESEEEEEKEKTAEIVEETLVSSDGKEEPDVLVGEPVEGNRTEESKETVEKGPEAVLVSN